MSDSDESPEDKVIVGTEAPSPGLKAMRAAENIINDNSEHHGLTLGNRSYDISARNSFDSKLNN